MRVVLCCIARNEELYINDFIKWYLNINVDTIYIYDNNDKKKKKLENIIDKEYQNKVVIIDKRGIERPKFQQECYNEFYKTYKDTFDWCVFCDVDEFLINIKDIKFLLKLPIYKKFQQIRILWKLYGDDNLIERDMSLPIYKVFKKEITRTWNRDLINIGNLEKQGKFILKGHLNCINITSPHFASYTARNNLVNGCFPSGKPCNSQVVIKEDYSKEAIYFNHYMTKSLSEFINQKLKRNDAIYNTEIDMRYYWRINNPTKEKLQYLKENGIENCIEDIIS